MAVVGAGTMGCGVAATVAAAGHEVILQDPVDKVRAAAMDHVSLILSVLADNDVLSSSRAGEAAGRVRVEKELACVKEAEFVIECVPENLNLKKDLFAQLSGLARKDAILATNTSSLSIAAIGQEVWHRERFLATHFYYPAEVMPLVELVAAPETAQWAVDKATAFLTELGKVVVPCPDTPGYIASRIQMAMIVEAITLLQEGIASAEDIDTAVRNSFGLRMAVMGPLETVDSAGLDVYLKAGETYHRQLGADKFQPPALLRDKVTRGELGVKSGHGFHDVSRLDPAKRASQLIGVLRHLAASQAPERAGETEPTGGVRTPSPLSTP